jgi:hypothetical protein
LGIRENNETTNAHNEQSLADNMKRMFELVHLNAYTAEQALANMDLHNTSTSAAQMWLQQYKVVAVNWKGYLVMQMRRGQAMVPTKFFSSPVAKMLPKDLMSLYIQEVHPSIRILHRPCSRAHMTVLFSGR